jgi:amidohydrolase
VELRHHLHRMPEPCFNEVETSRFVRQYLEELGFKEISILAKTGIKAVLNPGKPGPVVAVRTDLDALPIEEQSIAPHPSEKPGYMHACGHDIHMANFLVCARMLSQVRDEITGQVVLIAQPCEEGTPDGSPSGAQRMVDEGVLQSPKVDAVIGLHVMPGVPLGSVAFRSGPLMASVSSLFITIRGKASHGALPHQGIDAIFAAAQAITQFQSLVSRLRDPIDPAVLTIGTIHGGVRMNVIADEVRMEGTLRSFTDETETVIKQGVESILAGLKGTYGIDYDCRFSSMSRFVNNDAGFNRLAIDAFGRLLGPEAVLEAKPMTIAEDFAVYSHRVPSLFYFLGAGQTSPLHSSTFFPNDDILMTGPVTLAWLAVNIVEKLSQESAHK